MTRRSDRRPYRRVGQRRPWSTAFAPAHHRPAQRTVARLRPGQAPCASIFVENATASSQRPSKHREGWMCRASPGRWCVTSPLRTSRTTGSSSCEVSMARGRQSVGGIGLGRRGGGGVGWL